MSTSKSQKRRAAPKRDAISDLQATLDRQEARRKVLVRRALSALAAGLVILAAGAVLRGNPAAAVRGASVSEAPVQAAAIVSAPATEAQPAKESTAPVDDKASSSVPKPVAPEAAKSAVSAPKPVPSAPKTQDIRIGIGVTGYAPSTITASAGYPISLTVDKGAGCAAGFLIPALNVAEDNTGGPITIDLGRVPAGNYEFTCGMQMIGGTLIVE